MAPGGTGWIRMVSSVPTYPRVEVGIVSRGGNRGNRGIIARIYVHVATIAMFALVRIDTPLPIADD